MGVARELAEWGIELRDLDIPVEVRESVAQHLVDGIGCALAASRLGEVPAATLVASGLGGAEEATRIGSSTRIAAPNAALANGALVHALDFDDTHADALVHVTAAVLPAALAVAEAEGASGSELLTACVAGFEVVVRIGAVVRHGFHARGFHATSVCGVFAAALVASRLAGDDVETAANALGIAGSLAAGSLEFLSDGSSTKQLHPGLAAHAGIIAARLAAAGASGPRTIFEGDAGLYRAYADTSVDPALVTAGLGTTWESTQISLKAYPACQLSHASLEALRNADVEWQEVASVLFRVPVDAVPIVCEPAGKRVPRTPYDAKFSLPWCAAALLVDRELTVDTFAPKNLDRPELLELAQRIGHAAYEAEVVAAAAGGSVEVRTA